MKNEPRLIAEEDVYRRTDEERMHLRCATEYERFPRLQRGPADQPARSLERCVGPTDAVGKDILAPLVYQALGHVD